MLEYTGSATYAYQPIILEFYGLENDSNYPSSNDRIFKVKIQFVDLIIVILSLGRI